MLVKIKFVGSTTPQFTQNSVYAVLAFVSSSEAIVVDDNGNIASTGNVTNPSNWTAESVETSGCVQIYP